MATLSFSTNWPKHMGSKPTEFVDKIWCALNTHLFNSIDQWQQYYEKANDKLGAEFADANFPVSDNSPKLHTIRADVKNLWVPGRKIHMVVFNRTKNRFQFAPVLEVKAVQDIAIRQIRESDKDILRRPLINIDFRPINDVTLEQLAVNDGFNSVNHFFQWFHSDFTGKIIHWTNLKY